jgi:hypothetical protein
MRRLRGSIYVPLALLYWRKNNEKVKNIGNPAGYIFCEDI